MNIRRQHWLLSRRHVLRGVGVALALPLLDCMRPLAAADPAQKAERARRCVFAYLPNGVNTLDYQITSAGPDYVFSKSLRPLERHRAIITPISGLYHPNGIGNHHNCIRIWLTGGRLGPSDRNTISVDQLVAQVTAPHTRFSSIELATQGESLAWNADGIGLPAESNPSVVFRALFEEPAGGPAKERRGLHRRGSILDAILDEARGLDAQLGHEDRGRLGQYLTAVREVEVRTGRADSWLDTPRPTVPPNDRQRLDRDVSKDQVGDYFRTMYDLIVLAFQTDLTRVATFSTGQEGKGLAIPEIGIRQDRHSLSHHNGNPDLLRQLTDSDTFNLAQFSYLLDRLSTVHDADGPLIDSTIALYGSGMTFGHSHGNANLPIVVAGGAQLGLRHGRHVDFNLQAKFDGYDLSDTGKQYGICGRPVNEKALLSNLLLTVAQRLGVSATAFGDSRTTMPEILS